MGRAISLCRGADGAILLILIADSRGWIPASAGSCSNDCRRLSAGETLLGKYSSWGKFFLDVKPGFRDAVGWKYMAGL